MAALVATARGDGLFVGANDTVVLTGDAIVLNRVLAPSGGTTGTGTGGDIFLSSPGSTSGGTKIRGNYRFHSRSRCARIVPPPTPRESVADSHRAR
jgi:hypothetical protein